MGGRSNMDKPKLTPSRDIDELLLSECRGQERQVGIYGICTDEKEEEKKKKRDRRGLCQSQEITKNRSRVEFNMLQYTKK